MLRSVTVQNWKSYSNASTIDMIATREQRDCETLARTVRPSARILPVAALFGANAAGKSSLIEALAALKNIVVRDRSERASLPVHSCLFAEPDEPTIFEIEFIISPDDAAYRYTLKATPRQIIEESLVRVRSTVETVVFMRANGDTALTNALLKNNDVVKFVDTVENNETLLRRIGSKFPNLPEAQDFVRAFNWFYRVLQVVTPGSRYRFLPIEIKTDEVFREAMNQKLSTADTGIDRVEFQRVSLNQLELDLDEREELQDELMREGGSVIFRHSNGNIDLLSLSENVLVAERLFAIHTNEKGKEYSLPLAEESDGTVRFFELLPMVMDLESRKDSIVYVVDELDSSMHILLMKEIIESFLESRTKEARSQLIFSTHAASLLRSNVLRRDEIWFAQKSGLSGGSELVRLSDLSNIGIRNSTDLFSAFMAGQLPGAPRYNVW